MATGTDCSTNGWIKSIEVNILSIILIFFSKPVLLSEVLSYKTAQWNFIRLKFFTFYEYDNNYFELLQASFEGISINTYLFRGTKHQNTLSQSDCIKRWNLELIKIKDFAYFK